MGERNFNTHHRSLETAADRADREEEARITAYNRARARERQALAAADAAARKMLIVWGAVVGAAAGMLTGVLIGLLK